MQNNLSSTFGPLTHPSPDYFCIVCKRQLNHTIRIIARVHDQTYFNYCPVCLCSDDNPYDVEEYMLCDKLTLPLPELQQLTAQELIECFDVLDKEGIQQLLWRSEQTGQSRRQAYETYETLNRTVFKDQNLSMDIDILQSEATGYALPDKFNPLNKKHLRALGYSWQRQEFGVQPEMVFGYLMGKLEQNQEDNKNIQLQEVIYKFYLKEQQALNDINAYLVNSRFLLGRKGFSESEEVPGHVLKLRILDDDIKGLLANVHKYTSEKSNSEAREERERKRDRDEARRRKRDEEEKRKRMTMESDSNENQDARSRSRDKVQKRKERKLEDEKALSIANEIKKERIVPQSKQEEEEKPEQKLKPKGPGKGIRFRGGVKRQQTLGDSSEPGRILIRRKRGRPKGSLGKPKDPNAPKKATKSGKERFIVKMKHSSKRQTLQLKKQDKAFQMLNDSSTSDAN